MRDRLLGVTAAASGVCGFAFVALSLSYLANYLGEPSNPARNEYLEGVALSLMLSGPFWLLVSALTFPLRGSIPRPWLVAINIPGALFVAVCVLATVLPIIFYIVGYRGS